jgi:hypothetical protein
MRAASLLSRGLAPTALVLLASCGSPDTMPTESRAVPSSALAAKGAPQDSVRLGMTVSDDIALQIGSDGLGEYVNGASGMMVLIDVSGNLQISPNNANGSTPPERRLDVRYPAGLVYTYPTQKNFKFKSSRVNNGNPRIQDMAVGAALCYSVTLAHQNGQVQYENDYNVAVDPGATYALVTRTSATTWSVVSGGVASTGLDCGVDNMTFVKGTDLTVKKGGFAVGLVSLPFSITLRALP